MKKTYMKPYVEVEVYMLDAAIALNCSPVVTLGPEAAGKDTCKEFKDAFDTGSISTFSVKKPFYADGSANCNCYYSSADSTYFTS